MPNNNSQGGGNMDGTPSDIAGHSTNGITIPINHEHGAAPSNHYHNPPHQQHTQYHGQPQQPGHHHTTYMDSFNPMATGSPRSQPQQSGAQDYDMPHIMGNMGFNPHRDIDIGGIFDRGSLGRRLEPFGTYRKRTNKHDPTADPFGRDAFSIFHDDDPDFNFPQFNTIGRRRAHAAANDDFFNRVPPEFAHIIPENFGRRSTGMSSDGGNSGIPPGGNPNSSQQHQYYQPQQHQHQAYQQQQNPLPPHYNNIPLSAAELNLKSKELRDAAIQTEDPSAGGGERSEVDNAQHLYTDNLNQHGLRNTVDMGIKSPAEMNELHNSRSHSAPPPEQLQQSQQYHQQQRQNGGPNNTAAAASANVRNTPPPPAQGHSQFATQTTPPASGYPNQQPPYYAKSYYSPHQQQHGQGQPKEQTPPQPQTPGGSYIRTIPIFVEGRSEPIINAHKEIPNQNSGGPGGISASASANASANYGGGATAGANARAYTPPQQQQQQWQQGQQQPQHYSTQQQKSSQHRPTPLNTQHQPSPQTEHEQAAGQHGGASAAASGLPPQTPHTIDSINKIQDIQRDVLDLMGRVEQFTGTRKDKHYVYLDEMLTRNLLKLDTIDTNGKESIRLARKEAIKCIQASINVLEAKAEQNARNASQAESQVGTSGSGTNVNQEQTPAEKSASNQEISVARSESGNKTSSTPIEEKPIDATQIQTPIPLPPPEGMQVPVESPQNTPSSSTADTQVESSTKNGESK